MLVANSQRVLIVSSAGGHLMEALLAIKGVEMDFDIATLRLSHIKKPPRARKLHFLIDPHTSIWKYAINALQSLWLIIRIRPKVVLTNGAGIAIPCALIGKFLGAKLIFIENASRVHAPSKTGKFLYNYADLFIVQWPDLSKVYPQAVYGGCLL